MEKAALRQQMIDRRLRLDGQERHRLSAAAVAHLMETVWFRQARTIFLYASFRGEVETWGLAEAAMAAGKRLVYPRVRRNPPGLYLHLRPPREVKFPTGAYGIPEPDPSWPEVDPAGIDLVVVPGAAFDQQGNRLGYGGGYYDRTLPLIRAANPSVRFVGLAYSFQLVPELDREPHDVPLDAVATDAGLIRFE